MSSEWWEDSLPPDLNQGDIVADVPFVLPADPPQPLIHQTLAGGKQFGYVHTTAEKINKNGRGHYLGSGSRRPILVLNHGCDIDKPAKRLVCLDVRGLEELNPSQREIVQSGRSRAQLFLPDVPMIGDSFVDMRMMAIVPRDAVDAGTRLAVMTEEARKRLQAQIVDFFLRIQLDT